MEKEQSFTNYSMENSKYIKFIIAEHLLRLNKAIEKVYGSKVKGGKMSDENGRIVYTSLD